MILPGSYVGVLGGGQLGWMFVAAARAMGYRTIVFDPDTQSPAGAGADRHIRADFLDQAALDEFAGLCDAATLEFENVPVSALERVASQTRLSPTPQVLSITQDRVKEKSFVNDLNIETAAYKAIDREADIAAAFDALHPPLMLKTNRFGYDGKGQREVANQKEAISAFKEFDQCACILEQKVSLKREVSVIAVRGADDDGVCYPVSENEHIQGILHTSVVPARCTPEQAAGAQQIALTIADAFDYQGVMGVEFFVTEDDRLLVNEIAPRPHNSGHYTIDACATSQFQQQLRAMCGLPLGRTDLLSPVVMINLLGDIWTRSNAACPTQSSILFEPDVKLHLYGKQEARPRRKMGHFCVLGESIEPLTARARQIYTHLLQA